MPDAAKTKPIILGNISASAVLFQDLNGNPEHVYVVVPEGIDFMMWKDNLWRRNNFQNDYASATGLQLEDDTYNKFYKVCVADCYSPPLAIIRADNESEAIDAFADELTWAHVEEPDLADYSEDDLSYNSNGKPYDSSNIHVCEVVLAGVLTAGTLEALGLRLPAKKG